MNYVNYFPYLPNTTKKRRRDATPVFAPAAVTAGVGAGAGPDAADAADAAEGAGGASREMPKRPAKMKGG